MSGSNQSGDRPTYRRPGNGGDGRGGSAPDRGRADRGRADRGYVDRGYVDRGYVDRGYVDRSDRGDGRADRGPRDRYKGDRYEADRRRDYRPRDDRPRDDRYRRDRYAPPAGGGAAGPGGRRPLGDPDDPVDPDGVAAAPRPARSAGRAVAAVIALIVAAVSVSGWSLLHHYDGRVHHIDLRLTGKRPPAAARGARNILLVGSDSRAGTDGQFGQVDGQRSDTTMLAHISPGGATTMLSFPRDLWVTIPAYTDSAGRTHAAQKSKLNAAFSLGGPALLVRTLESLTNIRIDNYVQIDFVGFQAMTDAIGGVTVCVKELSPQLKAQGFNNLDDKMSGWHGHVGLNTLNGQQALAFVRQRYGLPSSDLDRIRRQQQFIGAVFRESLSSSVLLNPTKVVHLLNAATSALTVDQGTSLADLRVLALHLRAVDSGGVTFETVPASPGSAGGASVLLLDHAGLANELNKLDGSSTASASPRTDVGELGGRMRLVAASAPLGAVSAAGTEAAASATPISGSCTY